MNKEKIADIKVSEKIDKKDISAMALDLIKFDPKPLNKGPK